MSNKVYMIEWTDLNEENYNEMPYINYVSASNKEQAKRKLRAYTHKINKNVKVEINLIEETVSSSLTKKDLI